MAETSPEKARSDRSKRFLSVIAVDSYWGPIRRADEPYFEHTDNCEPVVDNSRTVRFESYPDGTHDVIFDPAVPEQQ